VQECTFPKDQTPSLKTAAEQLRFLGIYKLNNAVGPDLFTLNMPPMHW